MVGPPVILTACAPPSATRSAYETAPSAAVPFSFAIAAWITFLQTGQAQESNYSNTLRLLQGSAIPSKQVSWRFPCLIQRYVLLPRYVYCRKLAVFRQPKNGRSDGLGTGIDSSMSGSTYQPRLSPKFSGRSSSYCMLAFKPPPPTEVR